MAILVQSLGIVLTISMSMKTVKEHVEISDLFQQEFLEI